MLKILRIDLSSISFFDYRSILLLHAVILLRLDRLRQFLQNSREGCRILADDEE